MSSLKGLEQTTLKKVYSPYSEPSALVKKKKRIKKPKPNQKSPKNAKFV